MPISSVVPPKNRKHIAAAILPENHLEHYIDDILQQLTTLG